MPESMYWEMVTSHLDIIRKAARYSYQRLWLDFRTLLEEDDLYQSGILLAYDAAKLYNPDKETSFATYVFAKVMYGLVDVCYPHRKVKTSKISRIVSLDEPIGEDGLQLQIIDERDYFKKVEDDIAMDELFPKLWSAMTPREREMLYDRVVRHQPLKFTAKKWGVTESMVCHVRADLKKKVVQLVA